MSLNLYIRMGALFLVSKACRSGVNADYGNRYDRKKAPYKPR